MAFVAYGATHAQPGPNSSVEHKSFGRPGHFGVHVGLCSRKVSLTEQSVGLGFEVFMVTVLVVVSSDPDGFIVDFVVFGFLLGFFLEQLFLACKNS